MIVNLSMLATKATQSWAHRSFIQVWLVG